MPALIEGVSPNGKKLEFKYYPGGDKLDDLLIIEGKNYFGTAQYQMDDPLADIGFRFNKGIKVQAECIRTRRNFIDEIECVEYEVYRSSFDHVPEGSKFFMPELF
ncbi:hypothetical protein PUV47_16515 [Pseudovibrio exalbescens]|uniref:hypothetical protein n=1 Tax=Pseudovibrio exalbescens TaxID=197461 RepID=UPI002365E1A1|nr:hypothetical protein [Pseudovibrio exalbescens]MDD7911535.1 hypothetical protein [Pseudovibrio exalbescens]